ncbi:OmpA family protein [Kordia sp. YSTF-M3]|uniref:OmpA family protein n=1 Tax=Kordia aestuariivivens TaxID=2759037 RepID=A0ABR7QEL9_9FLAO|nr:OmpA family protein [Kordia aestuariivivens]MBC8757017.1 OmpA family protein [Kordia aestuariivivens]
MKTIVQLSVFLVTSLIFSQNLVLNPSFEECSNCERSMGQFDNNVTNWSTPSGGSTDYFNYKGKKSYNHYNGYQKPRTGTALAGIYVFTEKNYREYIQGELKKTLEKGKKYTITFYVSLAEKSTKATTDLDILFTEEALKKCYHSNHCEKQIKPKKATDKKFTKVEISKGRYYKEKLGWTEITFMYEASGFENYFSIGNFNSNRKTNLIKMQRALDYEFSYYYIDDVSVTPLEKEVTAIKEQEESVEVTPLKVAKIYTFKNVLFEFDKATLVPTSVKELDELYVYLQEKPTLTIEVYGHTDAIGTLERNKELSLERAKAVSDYLIAKGLKDSRIEWFGFGSSKPIVSNDTEAQRKKNRRVEFKLNSQ